jgi:hypothetical protein
MEGQPAMAGLRFPEGFQMGIVRAEKVGESARGKNDRNTSEKTELGLRMVS